MNISMYRVEKIELVSRYIENSNSRTICLTDDKGKAISITVYGNTDALDALPRAEHFVEYRKDEAA